MSRFFFVRTVKLGRIFGIRIEIDYSWFIIFALVFSSLAFQFFPELYGFSTLLSVLLGLLTTLLFFSSILVHELAHSVVANHYGTEIKKIILFIFGGVASLTHEPTKPKVELMVAIAGPLTSIIIGAFFYGVALLLPEELLPLAIALQYLALINGAVAAFNLLPGYPLDGGRILRALLWFKLDIRRATRIAAGAGFVVGVLIVGYGVWQLLYLGSLFGLIWFSLIGYFLISAARESVLHLELTQALKRVRVADLMSSDPLVVAVDDNLREVVEHVLLRHKRLGALVRRGETIVGEINLEEIRRVPVKALASELVREHLRPYRRSHLLNPEQPGTHALKLMVEHGFERLPVLDGRRLVGVVTRDDVQVYLAVRTDLLNRESALKLRGAD